MVKSRSLTSLPLWTPRPLAGCSWPATTTPRPSLQTPGLLGGCFWGPVTRRCPALWSWSLQPLWIRSSKNSKSRFVLSCVFSRVFYCYIFSVVVFRMWREVKSDFYIFCLDCSMGFICKGDLKKFLLLLFVSLCLCLQCSIKNADICALISPQQSSYNSDFCCSKLL